MTKLKYENIVHYPLKFVLSHIGKDMFVALNPPWTSMKVIKFDGTKISDEVHLELNLGFKKAQWISKIVKSEISELEFSFIDLGVKMLPGFKSWHHHHIFRKIDETKTLIQDEIAFETSNVLMDLVYYNAVNLQFLYRKYAYKKFLAQC